MFKEFIETKRMILFPPFSKTLKSSENALNGLNWIEAGGWLLLLELCFSFLVVVLQRSSSKEFLFRRPLTVGPLIDSSGRVPEDLAAKSFVLQKFQDLFIVFIVEFHGIPCQNHQCQTIGIRGHDVLVSCVVDRIHWRLRFDYCN